MGALIPFIEKRPSKVFTDQVKASLALANQVGRELKAHGCSVKFTCINGEQPLHMIRVGRSGIALVRTPGNFSRCRSFLLGCEIEWLVGVPPVAGRIGRVH